MTHQFPRAQHSVDGLAAEPLAQRREGAASSGLPWVKKELW